MTKIAEWPTRGYRRLVSAWNRATDRERAALFAEVQQRQCEADCAQAVATFDAMAAAGRNPFAENRIARKAHASNKGGKHAGSRHPRGLQ